ncbi:TPA: hypothetical protein ACH3X2_002666 [Trebouxia sp. C0005]
MSRLLARKGKRSVARPNQLPHIKQLSLSVVALLLILLGLEGRRLSHSAAARSSSTSLQTSRIHCLSWRQTLSCSPYGQLQRDLPCSRRITGGSGYCECTGGWTVRRVGCESHASFTCQEACDSLNEDHTEGLRFPGNLTCPAQDPAQHDQLFEGAPIISLDPDLLSGPLSAGVHTRRQELWDSIWTALSASGVDVAQPPGIRTDAHDFVRDGLHMSRAAVKRAQAQLGTFQQGAPAYPKTLFRGKGIVIMAGGLTYFVPAWINIHMLRKTGCTLPVEMFFPAEEYPTKAVEQELQQIGVMCSVLPDLVPTYAVNNSSKQLTDSEGKRLAGFSMKSAAVLLSSFEEIIFLDSDNVAITDPTALFDAGEYLDKGAVLWPDYWASSAAPDLQRILPQVTLPSNTFESGQMVLNKSRVWKGLVLAAFFNLQSRLYYELLGNFMGKGDKETFALGLSVAGLPYHVIATPVGSVGFNQYPFGPGCIKGQNSIQVGCGFAGNTMAQYTPQGKLMFLHTNMSPKWNLAIPADFDYYSRRWQILQPQNLPISEALDSTGRDPEKEVYRLLVLLRCKPFLEPYVADLRQPHKMGPEKEFPVSLERFHTLYPGMDFRRAYRWGMLGPFQSYTGLSLVDSVQRIKNVWGKTFLGRLVWPYKKLRVKKYDYPGF